MSLFVLNMEATLTAAIIIDEHYETDGVNYV